jgi:hypothetical protein
MLGAIIPLPNTPSWRGAQSKHRDNFTFALHLCVCVCFKHIPTACLLLNTGRFVETCQAFSLLCVTHPKNIVYNMKLKSVCVLNSLRISR